MFYKFQPCALWTPGQLPEKGVHCIISQLTFTAFRPPPAHTKLSSLNLLINITFMV